MIARGYSQQSPQAFHRGLINALKLFRAVRQRRNAFAEGGAHVIFYREVELGWAGGEIYSRVHNAATKLKKILTPSAFCREQSMTMTGKEKAYTKILPDQGWRKSMFFLSCIQSHSGLGHVC